MIGVLGAGPAVPPAREQDGPGRYEYTQYHMGVDARMAVYAPSRARAEEACAAAFARIAELDAIMSDYRADSELMKLCAKAGEGPVAVSPDLLKVLARAQEVARRSGGAFDVTVGPLVQIWRRARKSGQLPAPADLEAARRAIGWTKMRVDERAGTVDLATRGMRLDLGGIAKGYAADEAQRVLRRKGVRSALVELGGDIVVSGPPPGAEGWTIRVPNAGDSHGPKDMRLANRAISTSGDTEQSTVIGGVRYSHVVDPRTGMALTSRAQATVIASDGLTTDPLSTALTVLGKEEGARLVRRYRGAQSYVRILSGG